MKKETAISKPGVSGVGAILDDLNRRELIYRNDVSHVEQSIKELRDARDKHSPKDDGREWEKEMSALQSDLTFLAEKQREIALDVLKFEKGVTPEKRMAGESIQQGEGARLIEMAATHFRLGVEGMKLVVSQNWPLCKTEIEAFTVLNTSLTQCMETAFENALEGQSLPKWVCESVRAGL